MSTDKNKKLLIVERSQFALSDMSATDELGRKKYVFEGILPSIEAFLNLRLPMKSYE